MSGIISKNIKYLRKSRNLSQKDFGELVGGNRGNIDTYERGVANPSQDIAKNICNEFGITLDALYNLDLSKPPAKNGIPLFTEEQRIAELKRMQEFNSGKQDYAYTEQEFEETDHIIGRYEKELTNPLGVMSENQYKAYRIITNRFSVNDMLINLMHNIDEMKRGKLG